MLRKIFMTLLLSIACSALFAHDGMSVSSAFTDILSGDKERISEACEFLSTNRSDSTMVFVGAVLSGVYDDQVTLTRRDRMRLNKLKPYIDLNSSSPELRAESYTSISESGSVEDILLIKSAFEREADRATADVAQVALNKLYLKAGDDEQQGLAIASINEDRDMIYSTALSLYLEREDITNANRAQAKTVDKYFAMVAKNNNLYQNLFSGLSLGSILVLVSLGLSIVYGLAGIINMSHGEFLMIGAYTTYCVQQLFEKFLPESIFDLAFFVSLPISFVVAALFGLVIERLVLRHLYSRPLESMLATLGISLILIQLARTIFGDLTTVKAPAILSGGISLGTGLILPYNRLFIIVLTILIFVGVYLLFQRTHLGVRIRAVTQNRNMSACVGISTKKIDMITFMLGSGLAGIAGCAITLIGNVVPNMGQTYIVDSFLTVVTGGVGKLVGCAVSGVSIGVLSKVFEASFEAVYGKVAILLLIIIFLQYRPKGLFADKGRIGDD
ncbi:MAG: urea ABC transporter permease subunit UrtB [Rikenellaceae bacterium]